MMQSNQPYQRVDDGIGAGLIGGAVVGGALAGGAYFGLPHLRGRGKTVMSSSLKGGNVNIDPSVLKTLNAEQKAQMGIDESFTERKLRGNKIGKKMHGKMFGSGRRAAVTGGISLLGGGIIGAGIDGMNG